MYNFKDPLKKYIAAALIEIDGKILIAQRGRKDDPYRGLWEFPGGKVEGDETLEECLKRELYEELDIHAQIGEYFCTSTFIHKDSVYDMCVFKVHFYEGEIILHEHSAIAWVSVAQLSDYSYPAPDLPIIALLQK
jgi:mutator protein MutT